MPLFGPIVPHAMNIFASRAMFLRTVEALAIANSSPFIHATFFLAVTPARAESSSVSLLLNWPALLHK